VPGVHQAGQWPVAHAGQARNNGGIEFTLRLRNIVRSLRAGGPFGVSAATLDYEKK
jgi:uncharacterized protein (DUF1501 family)